MKETFSDLIRLFVTVKNNNLFSHLRECGLNNVCWIDLLFFCFVTKDLFQILENVTKSSRGQRES